MGDNPFVSVSIPHICNHLEAELPLKGVQTHSVDAHAQSQPDDIPDELQCLSRMLE